MIAAISVVRPNESGWACVHQPVAGENEARHGQERRHKDPRHGLAPRQEARHGADQREQDEGAQAADAGLAIALALLALDADQGADQ